MEQAEMRPLEIGSTIGGAFALIRQFPLKILGVAFLFGALPTRAVFYAVSIQTAHEMPRPLGNFETGFISVVVQTIVAGLLIDSATRKEWGIGSGLRRLPQLVVGGLLNAFGCMLAACCLLIPYFFVWTRWSVVGAVMANEETSINDAFGRSSDLTEGTRLRILGLLILSSVGQALVFMLSWVLLMPVTSIAVASQDFTLQPAAFATRLFLETVTIGFAAALQCSLYVALRERRYGPLTNELSEIFA